MTNAHYENFPVASPLLPPELRAPVRVIYAFARSADDLADEGDASASERIAALNEYERELDHIDAGRENSTELFKQLSITLKEHLLNTQLLRDLLSAFRQDVVQTRGMLAHLNALRRSMNMSESWIISMPAEKTAPNYLNNFQSR